MGEDRVGVEVFLLKPGSSGIATYTLEVAKSLGKFTRVRLFSLSTPRGLGDKLREAGVELEDVGKEPPPLGPPLEYVLLRGRLGRYSPRVPTLVTLPYLGRHLREGIVSVMWQLGPPLTYGRMRARTMDFPYNAISYPFTYATWFMERGVYRKSREIVCMTDPACNFSREYFHRGVKVPPPMEVGEGKGEKEKDRVKFLFVSRDISLRRKNFRLVAEAFRRVGRGELILVGGGVDRIRGEVETLRKVGVKVEVRGVVPRERMGEIYREADVLLYPSFYEELGYAVLEAMGRGLAVIVSRAPPFHEMVTEGREGFLVDPRDPSDLAKRLGEFMGQPSLAVEMGERGRERVMQENSPWRVGERMMKLLSS